MNHPSIQCRCTLGGKGPGTWLPACTITSATVLPSPLGHPLGIYPATFSSCHKMIFNHQLTTVKWITNQKPHSLIRPPEASKLAAAARMRSREYAAGFTPSSELQLPTPSATPRAPRPAADRKKASSPPVLVCNGYKAGVILLQDGRSTGSQRVHGIHVCLGF